MKVILATEETERRKVLAFELNAKYDAEVLLAANLEEAEQAITQNRDVSLLILDSALATPSLLRLAGANLKFPHVIVGTRTERQNLEVPLVKGVTLLGVVSGPRWDRQWSPLLGKYFDSNPIDEKSLIQRSFVPIRTELLLTANPLRGDVYIRLGATKHVKLFKSGDEFDRSDYERYGVGKGVTHLYLLKRDAFEFLETLSARLESILSAGTMTEDQTVQSVEESQEVVREVISATGYTHEVQILAKTTVKMVLKAMGKNPRLGKFLSRLTVADGKYISAHSVSLAQVACAMALAMKWESEMTFTKLTMAAFMHDISLSNDALAKIKTLAELEKESGHFTEAEVKDYPKHPMRSAEIVRRFEELPSDIEMIVAQHHELPDGSGFPRSLAQKQIAPLASLFIVAHEMVQDAMALKGKFELQAWIKTRESLYNAGGFKKALDALRLADAADEDQSK
jgi:hypothetical protein